MMQPSNRLEDEAILRIGEVTEVNGRTVYIAVDKDKNLSDLVFRGDILKNISVNSYIEIRKGFLSLIGKVDGERVSDDSNASDWNGYEKRDKNKRILTVSLSGFIGRDSRFVGGMKEMPLIGNEAYLLTHDKLHTVHNLVKDNSLAIRIAKTDSDDYEIELPVDGLFNSHIAIFGNTGSGKSNTLASLYKGLVDQLRSRNAAEFESNARFVLFDFNGEYSRDDCITTEKKVFNLTTANAAGDKIPLSAESLMNLEVLSILADATEKTQKPFIKRALHFYNRVSSSSNPVDFFQNTLRKRIEHTLQMSDKVRADQLLDYYREILPDVNAAGTLVEIGSDLEWHNKWEGFKQVPGQDLFLKSNLPRIRMTELYTRVNSYVFPVDLLSKFIHFLYIQLIFDISSNRAQNEHVAPAVNKLKSKKNDIDKIFDTTGPVNLWNKNFIVINLNDVNLEMKKTIPLLLSKKLYLDHKSEDGKSLTFIIDEAHNILSRESFREAESWKDYRLETFEEIIKEGRKFGVFVTISSQRPSDISATITSQAHNYFIHRLINQKDLAMISSVVSYIDKVTEDSIPVLPTGTCIFSGVASPMPLKLNMYELPDSVQPKSTTISYKDIVPTL